MKAHDTRLAIDWLSHEVQNASDVASDHGALRAAVAWYQSELCQALEDAPRHIYDKSASPPRIRAAFEGFWDCLNKLVAQSQHNGDFR